MRTIPTTKKAPANRTMNLANKKGSLIIEKLRKVDTQLNKNNRKFN